MRMCEEDGLDRGVRLSIHRSERPVPPWKTMRSVRCGALHQSWSETTQMFPIYCEAKDLQTRFVAMKDKAGRTAQNTCETDAALRPAQTELYMRRWSSSP